MPLTTTTGILDTVTAQFLETLKKDSHVIENAAIHLFYYLAVIQLTLTALWQVIAGESLQRLLADMVKLAFLLGFFYGLIYLGSSWVPDILNGFVELGQKTSVQSLSPSAVVSQGVSIAGSILNGFFDVSVWKHPWVSLVGGTICISICIIYALIAAELAIVLVKSYVLVATSGLFFAFGGFEITRPMTRSYVQAVLGIGLQMMTLYFLLSVGQHIGEDWAVMTQQAAQHHELMPMFVILITVIVYYMVLKNVPSFIGGLAGVGGLQNVGSAAVGMSINAAMQGSRMMMKFKAPAVTAMKMGAKGAFHLGKGIIQASLASGAASSYPTQAANDAWFKPSSANDTHFKPSSPTEPSKPPTSPPSTPTKPTTPTKS